MSTAISSKNPAAGIQKNADFRLDHRGTPIDGAGGTRSGKKRVKADRPADAKDTITELLGTDVAFSNVMTRNLDLYSGYPHTTTGIPYAIQGTAKVLSLKVGEYLAGFADPIKAILSTNVHLESRVIITRKYVVGGKAMITPEHAPARTVAIQEDVREVALTRYGGDIEMNLNLFLRPEDAKEELDMKVAAQRRELERTLVDMGYEMLMEQGTDLVDGIIRSSPLYQSGAGMKQSELFDAAERINIKQVFGAMSKHAYPIQNLLAAAKYASAYSTSNDKGSVLLLPHGLPDILRYTRQENMVYSIAGPALMQQTNGKQINMQLENSYKDPSSSVNILIHRQMPTFQNGVANPDVPMGGLTDTARFANYYVMETDDNKTFTAHITDYENGGVRTVEINSQNAITDVVVLTRRAIEAIMSSAILAAPGEETGSLLIGYPFTSVSTSSQEIVKIQMRVYMGSVLKRPENVIILRNVYFEGLRSGHKFEKNTEAAKAKSTVNLNALPKTANFEAGKDLGVAIFPKAYIESKQCIDLADFTFKDDSKDDSAATEYGCPAVDDGLSTVAQAQQVYKAFKDDFKLTNNGTSNAGTLISRDEVPTRLYRGTTYTDSSGSKVKHHNLGHMGPLDHFQTCNRLFGAFVYNSTPDPLNTGKLFSN